MELESERHQYQKLFNSFQTVLSYEDKAWSCRVVDISLHGCLLCFNNPWQQANIEAIYTMTMQAPAGKAIIMNLSISHVINNEVSFKCEHLDSDHSQLLHQLTASNPMHCRLLARELLQLSHPE